MKKIVAAAMILGIVGCSSESAKPATIACTYSDSNLGYQLDDVQTVEVDTKDQVTHFSHTQTLSDWESETGYEVYLELQKISEEIEKVDAEEYGYTFEATYDDESQVIKIETVVDYAQVVEKTAEDFGFPTVGTEFETTLESEGYNCK
ncbi:MAG: hypothetical protein ACK5LZ_01275 [Anaerorhabdus sp.]